MQVFTYLLDKVITECEPSIVALVKGCMHDGTTHVSPQALGFEFLGRNVLRLTSLYEQFKTHAAWQRLARVLAASIAGLFVATKMVSSKNILGLTKGLAGLVSINTLIGGNLFEDALYVVKTIVTALQSGDGIFEGFGDPDRNTLELRFAQAMSMKEVYISQDWTLAEERNRTSEAPIDDFPVDDSTFYGLLDHLCHDLKLKIATIDTKKTSADLYFYTRALAQASSLRFQVSDSVKRSGFKPAAYAFTLLGNSGVGKSVLIELIMSTLLKSVNYTDVKRLMCNINSGDKYLSGLHNGHKAVIIDDAVARKNLTGTEAGTELEIVRNFVGNQPIPLVSAAIEDKGRIMPFIDIVGLTTNVEHLEAHNTAHCPFSVLRRILDLIEVNTKPEYWREENGSPVSNTLKKLRPGVIDTDVYLFNVKRVVESRGGADNGYKAQGIWVPKIHDGSELTGLTWTQLIRYLVPTFQAHVADQRGKVQTMRDFFATPLCEHFVPQGTCDECRADPPIPVGVQVLPGQPPPSPEEQRDQQANEAHQANLLYEHLTAYGVMADVITLNTPASLIDPIGALCDTNTYRQEALRAPDMLPQSWLVRQILCRAWVKSLMGDLFAIFHGFTTILSVVLILSVFLAPSFAFISTATLVASSVTGILMFVLPASSVVFSLSLTMLSVCVGFAYMLVVVPLSLMVTSSFVIVITMVRLYVAKKFIRAMVILSHLERGAAARIQVRDVFSVNGRLLAGLSALVCMFLTGKLIFKLTRTKETKVQAAGLFSSRQPEQATEYVPTGPIVAPSLSLTPTERDFTTTCVPPANLTTIQDVWQKRDIYQRFPPPPERLATTNQDTIKRRLESCTFRIEITFADGSRVTQTGIFVMTNYFIMNAHGLYHEGRRKQCQDYRLFRSDLVRARGKLWDTNWVRLEKADTDPQGCVTDVALLFLPSAPSCPDLSDMFVDQHPANSSAYVRGLDNESKAYEFNTRVTLKTVKTDALGILKAYEYRCGTPLLQGYCGHPIVDLGNKVVLGIHCAIVSGADDKYIGCVVSASPLRSAMQHLQQKTKALRPLAAASMPAYGVIPASLGYGPVSNNSVLLQDQDANISVLPSLTGYVVPRYRKTFVRSRAADVLEGMGLPCRHLPPDDYGKFRVDKAKISSTKRQAHIPAEVLLEASYICHEEDRAVFRHLPPNSLGLLSIEDAINGVGGLGSIPKSTSAGFPFKGKKRDHLIEALRPDGSIYYLPTPELEQEVRTVWSILASGQRINAVYKSCHKAELVKPGKSTRVFEGIPFPFYIVMRMVFGALYAVYSAFSLQLSTVGGINPFGRDWHYIYEWMSVLTHEIAGDYEKFDASGEPQEKHITMHDVLELMKEFGNYDEETLNVASACAFEHIYHIALFRGDLSEFYGPTASGCFLTLLIGNRVNRQRLVSAAIVLFERHGRPPERTRPLPREPVTTTAGFVLPADYRLHILDLCAQRGLPSVFDHMILLTMGDDFRIRVRGDRIPFLNQRAIQEVFAEWDIVITDSHKNPVFEDLFTPEEHIDFLKRADRYDDDLDIVRGPLVLTSIFKPYYYYQPSPAISEDLYIAGLTLITEMELHMHGRQVYDEYHPFLEAVVRDLDLENYLSQPLQTYDEVTTAWRTKYDERTLPESDVEYLEVIPQVSEYCSYCDTDHIISPGNEAARAHLLLLRFRRLYNMGNFQRRDLERVTRELDCMFRRFTHLENDVAARYPEDYTFWAARFYLH
jgi:hypothetical protein